MTRRRLIADTAARWIVSAGGMATIASVVAIFVFICAEVVPLGRRARTSVDAEWRLSGAKPLAVAIDEYRELLAYLGSDGVVRVLRLADGAPVEERPLAALAGESITAHAAAGGGHVMLATGGGRLLGVKLGFGTRRVDGGRKVVPRIEDAEPRTLVEGGPPPRLLAASTPQESGVRVVYAGGEGPPVFVAYQETRNLLGAVQRDEVRRELPLSAAAAVSALALSPNGRRAFVATAGGYVEYWDLSDPAAPRRVDVVDASGRRDVAVTALGFLVGGGSLLTGDAAGRVRVWFPVRDAARESGWNLRAAHELPPHAAAIESFVASSRDRTFVAVDVSGRARLHHATTARTQAELPHGAGSGARVVLAPKADGGVTISADGGVTHWSCFNPHPEISLRALFGRVWYEGYEEPAFVWQSTGGTDDFEPKLSLVPLIVGTLKGTLYALMFAVPLSVFAALYTSQFVHPAVRNLVKPVVEIMAALPSVVLGFLAGLWLAPALEKNVPGVLAAIVALPLGLFAAGMLWGLLPARARLRPGSELVLMIPLVAAMVYACLVSNDAIESVFFGGDFRAWLRQTAGLRFDQRNSLVVGFAMGFAVIPIIFTISEDALSNVPQRLISGSLALGATPWQTAIRVVLPTASPGIFSAAMVGFGRAVGETMIVLMATGNTPVMDLNVFTGMRTLSANIAVEIPEAPHGSTLYRVLFLAALLLFLATFLVNTLAELIRIRLRRRYQQL